MEHLSARLSQYLATENFVRQEPERRRAQTDQTRRLSQLPFPKDASERSLAQFFTPEVVLERVIACPKIPVDLTDEMSMFGDEPGFVYLMGLAPRRTAHIEPLEVDWLQGNTRLHRPGFPCTFVPSYEAFPHEMFDHTLCTPNRNPEAFRLLCTRIL